MGVESFRFDEKLFLKKSDGKIYYRNYNNDVFEVADSFVNFWNIIDQKYDITRGLELVQDDNVSLNEEVCLLLKQCFYREPIQKIMKIYSIIRSDEEGLEIPLSENSSDGITLSTFYDKANFSLIFPFTEISDPRLRLPTGSWWRIGEGNEDEDTGPDNGTLIINKETGFIFWYSIIPDWIDNELRKLQKVPHGIFPSIYSILKSMFSSKLNDSVSNRPCNINFFKISDSFESFINNLGCEKKVMGRYMCPTHFQCVDQTPENQESEKGKKQKPDDRSRL